MNEIVKICDGYQRLKSSDPLFELLEPFYYEEDRKQVLCATPWKMVHKIKNNIAILLLHGYQGFPGEMIYPGEKLYNAGFDVFCPRYPGHGVSRRDFLKSKSEDWLGVARTTLGYLKKEYEEVYVVGHSMGGLIATILTREFNLKKQALIAPAFVMKGFSVAKIRLIKLFKYEVDVPWKSDESFWGICERDEGDDAYLGENYWSKLNFTMLLELNKIKDSAINALNKIDADTICILGEKDQAVESSEVDKLLNKKMNSPLKVVEIEESNHLCQYFNNKEKRDLCNDSIVNHFLS